MGALTLPSAGPIYLDSSAFIYSVERIEPYHTLLEPMWSQARSGQFFIVSSELVILETLVRPLREGDALIENLFRALFDSDEVRLVSTSRSIWERAAEVRASTGLKTPDALHVATAQVSECTLFVTNDGDFRRVEDLPVAVLNDFLTA